jgi:hypothetical protein
MPVEYDMSDDDTVTVCAGARDDEIYHKNPFEIRGKIVPLWARQESLERQIAAQRGVDADRIFARMPITCSVEKMFRGAQLK